MATLDQYVKHAELFGTDCVYETAEQEGHGPRTLAVLRVELDAIESGRKGRHGFSVGKRRRRRAEETAAAVVQLSVNGLVPAAIADKLGVSDAYVNRILKAA